MRNLCGSHKAFQLKIDTHYSWEYLLIAVVRRAVLDGDWNWVEDVGVDICELAGIDPLAFQRRMEASRGRPTM